MEGSIMGNECVDHPGLLTIRNVEDMQPLRSSASARSVMGLRAGRGR
jgi:hypothetical protein